MGIYLRMLPSSTSDGLGIPYESREGSNGMMEYFDLKRNPSLIPKVLELRKKPELQEFVRQINKSTSLFRTLRSEKQHTCKTGIETLPRNTHWHFTFAFEILDQNYQECYETFNKLLEDHLKAVKDEVLIEIELKLVPTSYRNHGVTLFSEDIEIFGLGKTDKVATNQFHRGLHIVKRFFASQSELYRNELNKGRVTIS